MTQLILEPTATAQWHALVSEAEVAAAQTLDETLESYLVFLLMRFVARPDLANRALAIDYLRGSATQGQLQETQLRDVGDLCLLLSGMYPQQADRRLVQVSYYVDLGRGAYGQLAERLRHAGAGVYQQLCQGFVALMDVLQAMRSLDGKPVMAPLQSLELWAETGSQSAWQRLRAQTDALPVSLDNTRHKPH
ncbi:MAG: hypothetical protein KKA36_00165 [Gammaproteobacteria bacterium]|nr:hypothetical protein [Gammaproteobacteria bacterium]MBU2477476.1 hypothetical protein [Gammaproteobacteria bacterium]